MKTIDKDNMFQSIWDFPENIIDALKISEEIKPFHIGSVYIESIKNDELRLINYKILEVDYN